MMAFAEKLCASQERNQSWLCIGLDPDPSRMPDLPYLHGSGGLATFCTGIVEATHDLVCAYKPNLAFFLSHGAAGIDALRQTLSAIPDGIPTVLDAKVGDIGNTQLMYGKAAFETLGVDAMTVNPYIGGDAVIPLLKAYPGRGLFVLCHTSNPDARLFQGHPGESPYLYKRVAEAAQEWARAHPESTVGLVIGATYPGDLAEIRQMVPDLPFLIPGIGTQGGVLEASVRFGVVVDGPGPLISVSRAILYAASDSNYVGAAREVALKLRGEINLLREQTV